MICMQYLWTKNLVSCGQTLFWHKDFITHSINACIIGAEFLAGPKLHVACVIYSYNYYFHLELWSIAICCTHLFLPADLSSAARTIHNTHGSYNFSVSSCSCRQKCFLLNGALRSTILALEKHYICAKFHQCHNSNPQSNFIQHSKINFPELYAH